MSLSLRVAARYSVRVLVARALFAFGVKDLEQLSKQGRSFGVISAYRSNLSKKENQRRHGELIRDLQKLGIRDVEPLKSHWEDMDTKVVKHEKSIIIPNIAFDKLVELGKKYEQDAVLFKDPSGSIGIYFKDGTATMAYDPKGSAAVQKSTGKEEYSKGRGLSFGLQLVEDKKFKWSDKPIKHDDIVEEIEKDEDEKGGDKSRKNFLDVMGDKEVANPHFDPKKEDSSSNPKKRKIRNLPREDQKKYYDQWAGGQ